VQAHVPVRIRETIRVLLFGEIQIEQIADSGFGGDDGFVVDPAST
jgi:hypothetical protein